MYGNHGFLTSSVAPTIGAAFYVGWWTMAIITALFLLISIWQLVRPASNTRP